MWLTSSLATVRRVIISGYLGYAIEFYGFLLYSTAAASNFFDLNREIACLVDPRVILPE